VSTADPHHVTTTGASGHSAPANEPKVDGNDAIMYASLVIYGPTSGCCCTVVFIGMCYAHYVGLSDKVFDIRIIDTPDDELNDSVEVTKRSRMSRNITSLTNRSSITGRVQCIMCVCRARQ